MKTNKLNILGRIIENEKINKNIKITEIKKPRDCPIYENCS